uniref:Peptidase A1 domain-containing protein n=1 Tax=Leersia perrieri TaxID=77586 RepID=A0A0D9XLY3_9ORYZ
MGSPVAGTTLFILCLISLTTTFAAAAFWPYDLRQGLEQAVRGRLLAGSGGGGAVVPISWSHAHYVANFTIGSPPQPASGIIDLSGELVWTQCAQCKLRRGGCFKQELPLFDPAKSNTYKTEPCGTDLCDSIPPDSRNCSSSGDGKNVCVYAADTRGGETGGVVGTDVFAVGSTANASLAFGCVVDSDIDAAAGLDGASGFVGLGRTPWSLVSQTGVAAFSYCLAGAGKGNSALFLGDAAKLTAGKSAPTTPFVNISGGDDEAFDNYYKVRLDGVKAGDAVIALPAGGSVVLLDTYSPVTFLVDGAYQALKKAVTVAVGGAPTAAPLKPFDVCFPKSSAGGAPELVLTFQGGAAMRVPPASYLLDDGNGGVCLAILSSARLRLPRELEGISILGSLQQENIHLLFDLEKKTLSFEPADCSKLN